MRIFSWLVQAPIRSAFLVAGRAVILVQLFYPWAPPRRGNLSRASVTSGTSKHLRRILFLIFGCKLMAAINNSLNTSARRDIARLLMDQARVVLVYLGIVATFTAATLIGCVIWLLIW